MAFTEKKQIVNRFVCLWVRMWLVLFAKLALRVFLNQVDGLPMVVNSGTSVIGNVGEARLNMRQALPHYPGNGTGARFKV